MALTLLDPTQTSKVWGYRRPVLQFGSITTVAVESGLNGTSGDVTVLFPDGKVLSVNSTTQTTFNITRNAALSGSKQSGLRTSLSEAVNTWYALYAVRATDNDDTWVTVGDTLLPLQANYATLNSNFGTQKWTYLGLVRNGDNSTVTGDILNFVQSGNQTLFLNQCDMNSGVFMGGTQLATTAGAISLAYTYSAGTGAANIPGNIGMGYFGAHSGPGGTGTCNHRGTTVTNQYFNIVEGASARTIVSLWATAVNGLSIVAIASVARSINLSGFTDTSLGIGPNPLLKEIYGTNTN